MRLDRFAWVTLIFAACTRGQTTTSCNPTKKSCLADTALSSSTYTHDFTQGADSANWNVTAGSISYTSLGAEFTITKSGDAPTIESKWYIFFGSVSFHIRTAPGTGIVSSAILQSDDLDEIDLEWLGGTPNSVQTDYFGKGNTTAGNREADAAVSETQTTSHNYTVQWTSAATTWYIDSTAVRTLTYADALNGANYPQTPMNIRIGIWAGGDSGNAEGTIEWAGGLTNYDDGPFTMYLEKVEVINYTPASTYTYGDMTGDWESIKLNAQSSAEADTASKASGQTAATTATGLLGAATASALALAAEAKSNDGCGYGAWQWQAVAVGALAALLWM